MRSYLVYFSTVSYLGEITAASSSFASASSKGIINPITQRYKNRFLPCTSRHDVQFAKLKPIYQVRGGSGNKSVSLPPLLFASLMTFSAGCSDVICYQRFHYYTSMMTGNLLMMSIAVAERNWRGVLGKISLIACFCIGAYTVRTIEFLCTRNQNETSSISKRQHLKCTALIVPFLFALYDLFASRRIWAVNLLPLAYGMVYSSANQALGATMTQLMTGHLTKLGTAVSDKFARPNQRWNAGSLMSFCIVSSFIIGAFMGVKISLSSFGKSGPFFPVQGLIYALLLASY